MERVNGRAVRFGDSQIEMSHGSGGRATRRLIEGMIAPLLANEFLAPLGDSALLDLGGARIALTADSFVVHPLQFPGGSIGELAVNGTVNDLCVAGAEPVALLSTLIVEAGLPSEELEREIRAMSDAARAAGVHVVGGDTKVVEHGKADGLYVTTAGIGRMAAGVRLDAADIQPGDRILVSGPIGDHGITILLARGELDLEADLSSDTRPIRTLVRALLTRSASGVRWMRDPTRGGVASALNEVARERRLGMVLQEDSIPLRSEVRGACEILGLDPLHIANEGQFLAIVSAEYAEAAVDALRATDGGEQAAIIGEVREKPAGRVVAVSGYGGTRVIDMLVGDPLPRIC